MATYASYRHIELDNVGCGKKKVLKPPGGGSSDIFGTASCDEVNPHKRGTNQKNLQSSIVLGGQTPTQSNGSSATNESSDKAALNYEPAAPIEINDTNFQRSSCKKKDGNPVTGEGYEAAKTTAAPAQHVSAQSEPVQEQKKASRVPPGGYSSGLW